MRTLMIANEIIADGVFDSVGGFNIFKNGLINPNADGITDFMAYVPLKKGDTLTAVMSLVAGKTTATNSFRKFDFNPFNFDYSVQLNGTDTKDFSTITYPTGNYTLVEPFTGGILIKSFDKEKNVFNTLKIVEFETSSTAWSTIKSEIVSKLNTLTDYITRVSDTKYTHEVNSITLEFIGSLNVLRSAKTFGEKAIISGVELAKLEVEFSPNSGGGEFVDRNYSYLESNFVVDKTKNYDILSIVTRMPSERALLPESAGLETTCLIAVPTTDNTSIIENLIIFLDYIKSDPSGLLVQTSELNANNGALTDVIQGVIDAQ